MSKDIWSDDLTDAQLKLLMRFSEKPVIELFGPDIVTGRGLRKKGLALMSGDKIWPTGDGFRVLNEFADEPQS